MSRTGRPMRRSSVGAAALAALLATGGAAENVAGTPRVIDGDTLDVAGVRVQLFGIDAPEPRQSCRNQARRYPCGAVATAALKDLTAGLAVVCKPEGAATGGELSATCFAEGYDVNENMVYTGWALADRSASTRYVATEEAARLAGRGLWRGDFVPPWAWRRGERLSEK